MRYDCTHPFVFIIDIGKYWWCQRCGAISKRDVRRDVYLYAKNIKTSLGWTKPCLQEEESK